MFVLMRVAPIMKGSRGEKSHGTHSLENQHAADAGRDGRQLGCFPDTRGSCYVGRRRVREND